MKKEEEDLLREIGREAYLPKEVICEYCGEIMLDEITTCPFCKKERGISEEEIQIKLRRKLLVREFNSPRETANDALIKRLLEPIE